MVEQVHASLDRKPRKLPPLWVGNSRLLHCSGV